MKLTKRKFIFAALMALTIAVSGCGKLTEGDDSVTNPGANTLRPTGTVQGVLTDRVTKQPIAGAVVDIDGMTATTNDKGQYSLRNVPATCDNVEGSYNNCVNVTATIDLRGVTSPVNMTATGTNLVTPRYPDFAYDDVEIWYTSLNDTDGSEAGSGSGTNHDTPVTGLMMSMDVAVGKLAATITGVVAGASDLQAVGAGYTVQLVSKGSNNADGANGGTGNFGNIVGSTTTDANGAFTFANIESLQNFDITAVSSDGMTRGVENVTAPSDGQTKTLVIQRDDTTYDLRTVLVGSIDNIAPIVISVTPENRSDISPTGGVNVVFTFSEPIKQDVYATTLTKNAVFGAASGLWADVQVNYTGAKAGNIAHTLTWTDSKTLTVNIPTLAPASRYEVALCQDNNLDGDCADVGEIPASLVDETGNAVTNLETVGRGIVTFTTNGAAAAAAPSITLTNAASIDVSAAAIIDWNPTSGAKEYNVYCRKNQVWGTTVVSGPYEKVETAYRSTFVDSLGSLVERDEIKLTYDCVVRSVNGDGSESADSNAVTVADVVGPILDTNAPAFVTDISDDNDTILLSFNEWLDEVSAETAANYVITVGTGTAPTVTSAVYSGSAPYDVTLTLSAALPDNTLARTISAGPNGIAQTTVAGDDTQVIVAGAVNVNGPCVTENVAGTAATAAAGDDVQVIAVAGATTLGAVIVNSGPNGVCATTATAPETQAVAVGGSWPATTVVVRGVNTVAGGDDVVTEGVVVTVSAVKDVAGNTIRAAGNTQSTDGSIQ